MSEMVKTDIKITRFEDEDYYIDVIETTDMFEAKLINKESGLSGMMCAINKYDGGHILYESFVELVASLKDDAESDFESIVAYIHDTENIEQAKKLWEQFEDVPMNPETECIESDWKGFPIGTNREEIWHWFEEQFNISVAKDLMGV